MANTSDSTELIKNANPQLREAVRLYTDPLLPTFGNKTASAMKAGYPETRSKSGQNPLNTPTAQAMIEQIREDREEAGREVEHFIRHFVKDAARELIQQLSVGRDLTIIDPSDIVNKEHATEEELERAKQITQHNRTAIKAAKERREALALILAYTMGTPEQRMRVTRKDETEKVTDLGEMSNEELRKAIALLREMKDDMDARNTESPVTVEVEDSPDDDEADFEFMDP